MQILPCICRFKKYAYILDIMHIISFFAHLTKASVCHFFTFIIRFKIHCCSRLPFYHTNRLINIGYRKNLTYIIFNLTVIMGSFTRKFLFNRNCTISRISVSIILQIIFFYQLITNNSLINHTY